MRIFVGVHFWDTEQQIFEIHEAKKKKKKKTAKILNLKTLISK